MGKSSSKPKSLNSQFTQAILQDDTILLDFLIEEHPHLLIKPVNDNLWTPLMLACFNNSFKTVIHLIETYKVSLDEQDYNGFTALIHVVYVGTPLHLEIAEYLCVKGADLSKKTNSGITAYDMARANNNKHYKSLIEYHLKYGAWAKHPFQTRKKLLWIYKQSIYKTIPIHIIKEICMYM